MNNTMISSDLTQHQLTLLLLMAETRRPMELYDFMRELDERYIKNKSPGIAGRFSAIVTPRLMDSLDALQAMDFIVRGDKQDAPTLIRPYGPNGTMVGFNPQAYSLTEIGAAFVDSLIHPQPKPPSAQKPKLTLV